MSAWETVLNFRKLSEPTTDDVIRLECAFMNILKDNNSNSHHVTAGYSKNFGRFLVELCEPTNKQMLGELRQHYWLVWNQQKRLENIIKKREEAIQAVCQHVWEKDWDSRDHRSHYECKLCGKYR